MAFVPRLLQARGVRCRAPRVVQARSYAATGVQSVRSIETCTSEERCGRALRLRRSNNRQLQPISAARVEKPVPL